MVNWSKVESFLNPIPKEANYLQGGCAVVILGDVGSGKTTYIREVMEKQLKLTGDMVARVDEDVERWSDKKDPLDGRNLLEQASDPFGEMGFNFQ